MIILNKIQKYIYLVCCFINHLHCLLATEKMHRKFCPPDIFHLTRHLLRSTCSILNLSHHSDLWNSFSIPLKTSIMQEEFLYLTQSAWLQVVWGKNHPHVELNNKSSPVHTHCENQYPLLKPANWFQVIGSLVTSNSLNKRPPPEWKGRGWWILRKCFHQNSCAS